MKSKVARKLFSFALAVAMVFTMVNVPAKGSKVEAAGTIVSGTKKQYIYALKATTEKNPTDYRGQAMVKLDCGEPSYFDGKHGDLNRGRGGTSDDIFLYASFTENPDEALTDIALFTYGYDGVTTADGVSHQWSQVSKSLNTGWNNGAAIYLHTTRDKYFGETIASVGVWNETDQYFEYVTNNDKTAKHVKVSEDDLFKAGYIKVGGSSDNTNYKESDAPRVSIYYKRAPGVKADETATCEYDGEEHGAIVELTTSDTTVTSDKMYVDSGTYEDITYRVTKDGYLPIEGKQTLTITRHEPYMDENGNMCQSPNLFAIRPIDGNLPDNKLTDGWWIVDQDTEINDRFKIDGDVHLILKDGCTLTANDGITVTRDIYNFLTVYGQEKGTGQLKAYAKKATESFRSYAAIGGYIRNEVGENITINGGIITAETSIGTAIGGAAAGEARNIVINGGTVNAISGGSGVGIGAGHGWYTVKNIVIQGENTIVNTNAGFIADTSISHDKCSATLGSDLVAYIPDTGEVLYNTEEDATSFLATLPNNKNIVIRKATPIDGASLRGNNITLNGEIAVNYYMELSDELKDRDDVYMEFEVAGKKTKVTSKEATDNNSNGVNYKIFTCRVVAKEMNEEISSRFVVGDESKEFAPYSVKKYGESIINSTNSAYQAAKPVVKAMLNYGGFAQVYFASRNGEIVPDEKLANNGIYTESENPVLINQESYYELSDYVFEKPTDDIGLAYYGASLLLESKTTVRMYIKVTDENIKTIDDVMAAYTFTLNGKTVTPIMKQMSGNLVLYVQVENIAAHNLGKIYNLKAVRTSDNASLEIDYGPMNYVQIAYKNDEQNTRNLFRALYIYFTEAANYGKPH